MDMVRPEEVTSISEFTKRHHFSEPDVYDKVRS